jgi:protein dithiol:quinone oxidoreductase
MIGTRRDRRIANLAGLAIVAALMGYALYSEHVLGLEPCPLCIFQRMAMIALGAVFLVGALHAPAGAAARIYSVLGVLAAATGVGIAGRHVWLQSLPPDAVPACGPGLEYMMDVFPFMEMLSMVFTGSGECAEVDWTFLGLSMPGWVLVWFVLLGAGIAAVNWRRLGS